MGFPQVGQKVLPGATEAPHFVQKFDTRVLLESTLMQAGLGVPGRRGGDDLASGAVRLLYRKQEVKLQDGVGSLRMEFGSKDARPERQERRVGKKVHAVTLA